MASKSIESNLDHVLGTAVLKAGKFLGLSQSAVGEIIGRSHITIGQSGISPQSKSGELGVLLVRIFDSLHAILGGNEAEMKVWMKSPNSHLGGEAPLRLLQSVTGVVTVVEYLDMMRAKA